MRYVEYSEYTEIGGTLGLAAFNRAIDRACLMIDTHTQDRLKEFAQEDLPRNVKLLCRDLVEYITENTVNKAVTSRSQSAGGVSESESYQVKSAEEYHSELTALIHEYLHDVRTKNDVPVLYRGCAC